MFYSLSGKLIYANVATAVIECSGVGFKCNISLYTSQHLPKIGSQATIYTHLVVREAALELFGFYDMVELDLFKLITSVSGVGPKAALSILSAFQPDELTLAIASGDSKSITRANGVGAKLAQRIVLELRDKVGDALVNDDIAAVGVVSASRSASEAVEALVSLGYSQSEASLAVGRLDSSLSVEQLIKDALKTMGGRF